MHREFDVSWFRTSEKHPVGLHNNRGEWLENITNAKLSVYCHLFGARFSYNVAVLQRQLVASTAFVAVYVARFQLTANKMLVMLH